MTRQVVRKRAMVGRLAGRARERHRHCPTHGRGGTHKRRRVQWADNRGVIQKRFVSRHRVYSAAGILVLVLCAWGMGVQDDAAGAGSSRVSGSTSILLQGGASMVDPMTSSEMAAPGVVVTGNGVDTGSVLIDRKSVV